MEHVHCWSPEWNHAVLLLLCPFHFLMAMRDSRLYCHHRGWKIVHLMMIYCNLLPLPLFFFYFRLITIRINSQLLALTPAVLLILSAGLSPRGMRAFFGSFRLIDLGLSEVFIASITFLEIWLPSVVICLPRASASFSKQFPIFVTSRSWIGACFQSFTMHWKLFWSSILIISTDRDRYLKFQKLMALRRLTVKI